MAGKSQRSLNIEDEYDSEELDKYTNHILAIGIDKYSHCPKLYNCVKDVTDFKKVLSTRFRFNKKNITTLFNSEATRDNIYNTFLLLAEKLTPQDNLIIYFSGHGEYNEILKKGFWIPVDAKKGKYSQYLNNSEVKDLLSAIKAHHTFLISDSCFSGSLFAKGLDRNVSRRYERDPSRWGLTAGRNEVVSDGKPGDNSPFAESLLYRLRHANKAIGVQELCAHVIEEVGTSSKQSPVGEPLKIDGHKNGQFVFHLKKNALVDWRKAEETHTIAAYQLFIKFHLHHKNTWEANKRIAALQATEKWEIIRNTPDTTSPEIKTKIRLVKDFIRKYKYRTSEYQTEAYRLGEYLEYKQSFLNAQYSYFKLLAFADRETPFRENARDLLKKMDEADSKKKETPSQGGRPSLVNKVDSKKKETPSQGGRPSLVNKVDSKKKEAPSQGERPSLVKTRVVRKEPNSISSKEKKRPININSSIIVYQKYGIGSIIFILVLLVLFGLNRTCNLDASSDIIKLLEDENLEKIGEDSISNIGKRGEMLSESEQNVPFLISEMVKVKGGSFIMGCTSEQGRDCYNKEKPAHRVTLDSYLIGKTEVTNEQYVVFLNNVGHFEDRWLEIESEKSKIKKIGNLYQTKSGFEKHPVIMVSWYGAVAYCNWLSEKEKRTSIYTINGKEISSDLSLKGYRLPTEAEWEYAARSRGKKEKYAGTNKELELSDYANCLHTKNEYKSTAPVASSCSNDLELFDMSGNVWEWCEDLYSSDYYKNSKEINPCNNVGDYHVIRGGSWFNTPLRCRVSSRYGYSPSSRDYGLGFRLVFSEGS